MRLLASLRGALWLAGPLALFVIAGMAVSLRPHQDLSAASSAKVDAAVVRQLASAPSVRVIVSLRTKPSLSATGAPVVSELAPEVAGRQAALLAAVPRSEFTPGRQYRAVPAIAGTATIDGVAELAAQPEVARISLDLPVQAQLVEAAALVNAADAHTLLNMTGAGVTVAVLDTGVDTDHPLLSDDIVYQRCLLSDGGCPGGGTSGPSAEDDNGHGTHVTGIITSNGPPAGIAPDASIDAFKVLTASGSGNFSDVVAAYDEIILNHPEVEIINMSLAVPGAFAPDACDPLIPAFATAVATTREMGIVSFAASGNNGAKTGIAYPACVNGVVSVGAVYDADLGPVSWAPCADSTTAPDRVVCFSQSHPQLDLLAPGSSITSTIVGGGTGSSSGTSMASPAAAGVAALLRQSEPLLTPDDVVARLRETGAPVTDGANGVMTCRVDAYEAIVNDGGALCIPSGPAAPINDDFINAEALGTSPPQLAAQSTAFSTTEPGEPSPCAGIASTAWYSFTPQSSNLLVVDTVGSTYDTALAVYEGNSLEALTSLGCNDDTSGAQSKVQFAAAAGHTYQIQAGGFMGTAGSLQLRVSLAPPTPTPEPTKQPNGDTDGDGCDDLAENGPNEALGGRRDYLNPWDFYDTNGDGAIDLFFDVFGVAQAFGLTPADAGYSPSLDRSPPPAEADEPDSTRREPWDTGPPDGSIDLFTDIFAVAYQFGHACS